MQLLAHGQLTSTKIYVDAFGSIEVKYYSAGTVSAVNKEAKPQCTNCAGSGSLYHYFGLGSPKLTATTWQQYNIYFSYMRHIHKHHWTDIRTSADTALPKLNLTGPLWVSCHYFNKRYLSFTRKLNNFAIACCIFCCHVCTTTKSFYM